MHCKVVLQFCTLLASLAALIEESKLLSEQPVAGQNRIIIEAGAHPILDIEPVDIYSSCCPETEQNITLVQNYKITDVTPSLVPPSFAGSWPQQNISESIVALVKDNQIVLRNVTLLDKGHIYQVEVEYQYNCRHNKTNICVPYCRDQCVLHHQHLESYICICSKTPFGRFFLDYTYLQKLTVDFRTYGLQLEIDCSGCSQNDSNSELTCKDSSMKFRCSSGLHDASDLWMFFTNHKTNRTAYCRPNQQRKEFHNRWVLHRETSNYDCVLEIPSCDYEDAGDYQCNVFIPNKGSWAQSETRSIDVQSTGLQNGWQFESMSVGIGVAIGGVVVAIVATMVGIIMMGVKHRCQANQIRVNVEDQNDQVEQNVDGNREEQRHLISGEFEEPRYDGSAAAEGNGRPANYQITSPGSSKESSQEQYYDTNDTFSS